MKYFEILITFSIRKLGSENRCFLLTSKWELLQNPSYLTKTATDSTVLNLKHWLIRQINSTAMHLNPMKKLFIYLFWNLELLSFELTLF